MRYFLTSSILLAAVCLLSFSVLRGNMHQKDNDDEAAAVVRQIYDVALTQSECYENLRYLATRIGARISGSPQAAAAVEWGRQTLDKLDIDSTYLQPCMVPHWVRGPQEKARIISRHIGFQEVNVCALGNSIGTGKWGISAPVVEIKSLDDLKKLDKKSVAGKIVFLNKQMDSKLINTFGAYSGCVNNRYEGPSAAAKMGAVGFLLRSLASNEDEWPHTGNSSYEAGVEKIPAAAIATRDAELLSGLLQKDTDLRFYLNMQCELLPDAPSYNVIGEIKGSDYPDEVVLVGGHLDSWDNGQGAHDDGAGVVHSIEVLHLFKKLHIKPKRTVRCVLFMNEENGARGAEAYAKLAAQNGEKCILAIESDAGGFSPRGFSIDTPDSLLTAQRLKRLETWKSLFQAHNLFDFRAGFGGVDINPLKKQGVTCMGLSPDPQRYFDHHHTSHDTFDQVNKRELELGSAAMASVAFLISEYGW